MTEQTEHKITSGAYRGYTLRMHGDAVQARKGRGKWLDAPLRKLAAEYPSGEGPWPWLLEQGVWRPSPSGTTIPAAERKDVTMRVPRAAQALARELADRWGLSPGEAVQRALERAAK